MSIMVGRPRKIGKREKNGRVQRVHINPKDQVAAQPHRMGVILKFRDRPEAESEFGRLMLNGKITVSQYEAGKRYADLASRYRVVLDIPPLHPTAMDFERTGGRGGELPAHVARSIRREYDDAFCACGDAGNKAQRAVRDFAVFERVCPDRYSLTLLISGLDRLVKHFGLDPRLQISVSKAR